MFLKTIYIYIYIYIHIHIYSIIFSSFFSKLFFGEVFETLVILSAISFSLKLPVVPAVLQIEAVLSPSVADFLA